MASQINLFPHSFNQSVISMPTDTSSCAAPVSLSVWVLPVSSFPPPPQSIRSFYAAQKRILCHYCESVCPSSAQFSISFAQLRLRWPPTCCIYLSWWGSWFCYLAPLTDLWLHRPAVSFRHAYGSKCPLVHVSSYPFEGSDRVLCQSRAINLSQVVSRRRRWRWDPSVIHLSPLF